MKAKKMEALHDQNRQQLHTLLPLDTPFTTILEPITYCNLKCSFCFHTLDKEKMEKSGHVFAKMSRNTFDLVIKQIKDFPQPIKSVCFVGDGEPLMHNELPYMVRSLKQSGAVERTTIITNGVLLSNQLSDELVAAGLDDIKISVNGMSCDDYLKVSGVKIDFDKYVSQIKYLFEHKKQTRISIKILDVALGENSENAFYSLFGDCCDRIAIERVHRGHPNVNYDKVGVSESKHSHYNDATLHPDICSALFYILAIRATGKIQPCSNTWHAPTNDEMHIQKTSLLELWNSNFRRHLMLDMLKKNFAGVLALCKDCPSKHTLAFEQDYLDPYADEIYERILKLSVKED